LTGAGLLARVGPFVFRLRGLSAFFILGIIAVSLVSRVSRTTELRVEHIEFDEPARRFVTDSIAYDGASTIIANRRQAGARCRGRGFPWSEGNPLGHLFRYLILGRGYTAPVVREIIRTSERDPALRPRIHVG